MTTREGSVALDVGVGADEAFALVLDIERLPEWNTVIQRVVQRPPVLEPGAEWVVDVKPPGMPSWNSRSTVLDMDRAGRRFRYRSVTDDGNPSWGDWEWQVEEATGGARVTVRWELHPQTFMRRVLLSRIRNRALRREVPVSIGALAAVAGRGRQVAP